MCNNLKLPNTTKPPIKWGVWATDKLYQNYRVKPCLCVNCDTTVIASTENTVEMGVSPLSYSVFSCLSITKNAKDS